MSKVWVGFITILTLLSGCASESGSSADGGAAAATCPAVGDLIVTVITSIDSGTRCLVGGTLTQNATLPASREWLIDEFIHVGNGTSSPVLTIEPGVHIRGGRPSASTADYVYISPGSSLTAIGTRTSSVMTAVTYSSMCLTVMSSEKWLAISRR